MFTKPEARLRALVSGIATRIPMVKSFTLSGTGGTISARYCYSVWLRHLVKAYEWGLTRYPRVIGELGPGDSLGIGLSAVLGGSNHYLAMDIVAHANFEKNREILEELIYLYLNKVNIPDDDEFPNVYPKLDSYAFPDVIFPTFLLSNLLDNTRLGHIRTALKEGVSGNVTIKYAAPWDADNVIEEESLDMIFSQAVLEHVVNLDFTYKSCHRWLKKDGLMSHTIDFGSHSTTVNWNGHWTISDLLWNLIKGGRPYLINRFPMSIHSELLNKNGFIVNNIIYSRGLPLERKRLAKRFRHLSEEDLKTKGCYLQASKQAGRRTKISCLLK